MAASDSPDSMGRLGRALEKGFELLASLKLAVVNILSLAASLTAGTFLESIYDTATAQYYVYRSVAFHILLGALGVNIFAVMVDRWPWKVRHTPFLMAHIGILMLLTGSWVTERFGLDGSMRVSEGETARVVESDFASLVLTEKDQVQKVSIPWIPPHVEFNPIVLSKKGIPYDLTVDQWISHAEPVYTFIPNVASEISTGALKIPTKPALHLKIEGGPMRITQEFWLWTGDASFRVVPMGPARFALGESLKPKVGHPSISFIPQAKGGLSYQAHTSDGKVKKETLASTVVRGAVIQPGWKGGVKLTVLDWVKDAVPLASFKPSRVQYGQGAPPSAIHVISGRGGEGAESWLGWGDRAVLHTAKGEVEIGYFPHRVVLPFGVRLDRFHVSHYEGSLDPSAYSSDVTVEAQTSELKSLTGKAAERQLTISMNEPLSLNGISVYQASYEDAQPRPVVSIFSVNRDPGRTLKYFGSLLIVLGAILLFAVKYRKAKIR